MKNSNFPYDSSSFVKYTKSFFDEVEKMFKSGGGYSIFANDNNLNDNLNRLNSLFQNTFVKVYRDEIDSGKIVITSSSNK